MDLRQILPTSLGLAVLMVIGVQTSQALRQAGSWRPQTKSPAARVVDPYARLDRMLAQSTDEPPIVVVRDPFMFGRAPVTIRTTSGPRRPAPPPPRPQPVLTAIVADQSSPEGDHRALIRFEDRNYSVRTGDQFAEFRVISINADQVVLGRRGERLTLRRPTKGD